MLKCAAAAWNYGSDFIGSVVIGRRPKLAPLKVLLRVAAGTMEVLWTTIGELLDCCPAEEWSYLSSCGYEFTSIDYALGHFRAPAWMLESRANYPACMSPILRTHLSPS